MIVCFDVGMRFTPVHVCMHVRIYVCPRDCTCKEFEEHFIGMRLLNELVDVTREPVCECACAWYFSQSM